MLRHLESILGIRELSPQIRAGARVALVYLFFGVAWIYASDHLLPLLASSIADITVISTVKGLLFVAITSFLLFSFVRRDVERILTLERAASESLRLSESLKSAVDEAERSRRQIEERYRLLVEMSPEAVFINYRDRVDYINPAGIRLFGAADADQMIGKPAFDLFDPAYHPLIRERIAWMHEHRLPVPRIEERIRRIDGSYVEAEVAAAPMPYKDAEAIQVLVRDISERKRTERELRLSHEQLRHLSSHLQTIAEQERKDLARTLHDELGQSLTGLKMDLMWIRQRLPAEPVQLRERVDAMFQLIDQTIQSIRTICTELRPGILDDFGLSAAVEWQTEEFQRRSGIRTILETQDTLPVVPAQTATALFRVLKEALTNIARSSRATEVRINLRFGAGKITLAVRDNGRGITKQEIEAPDSLGLLGMRERMHAIGGGFVITGEPGKGSLVTASVPVTFPEPGQ